MITAIIGIGRLVLRSKSPKVLHNMTADNKTQTDSGLIAIKIRTILDLKKVIGSREVTLLIPPATTLKALLRIMVKKWGQELATRLCEPDSLAPRPYIRLMVNGRDIAFLNRLETELREGDEVLILPPVSGG
jgi:molybdopterin synthase sulfur carrier subunit